MLENLKLGPHYDGFLFMAESARNPPVLKPHNHRELELNLVVRGTITYVVERRRFTFEQRSLLWMFPAQEHQLVDRSADAQYYVAVFKPALIRRSCHGSTYQGLTRKNVDGGGVLNTVLDPRTFDTIVRTMEVLMEGSLDPDLLNREAGFGVASDFSYEHGDPDGLNAGLHHLLLLCWRSQQGRLSTNAPVSLHPSVRKSLELLGKNKWSQDLAGLARHCGMSEAYLSRVFARQIGVTLNRYRNSVRLGRFLEIFREPEQKTLAEAVFAAGFGSYAQFYKVFREAYGCGPRDGLRRQASRLQN